VTQMPHSASASLGSEFDDFLFASIGEDRNGMLLSVLSALARLDVDPWHEAAQLARLPGEIAAHRLAALIARLPDGALMRPDPGTIAARLIALLPRPVSGRLARSVPVGSMAMRTPWVGAVGVVIIACAICILWLIVEFQPPLRTGQADAPVSSIATTLRPTSNSEP
jgi:hypothetical protein